MTTPTILPDRGVRDRREDITDQLIHAALRNRVLDRDATSKRDTAGDIHKIVSYWHLGNAWVNHSCQPRTRYFAKLTSDRLASHLVEHAVKRDLVSYHEELTSMRREFAAQQVLFVEVLSSLRNVFGADALRGIDQLISRMVRVGLQRGADAESLSVDAYIERYRLAKPLEVIRALAREVIGPEAKVHPASVTRHRDNDALELVVELRYPAGTTSREALRTFLHEYSGRVAADAQTRMTILRVPT